jgi:short-subunit dehydrogenase
MAHSFALVTGASSGIGEAFARLLPRETDLLLTGRDGARLAALRDELGAPAVKHRRVEILTADLASEAGRAALIERAAALPIDLLINNAGLGRFGALADNPAEAERAMVEVNVLAPVLLTRALLPGMLQRARAGGRRAGVIVLASTAGFAPLPYLTTYAATKAFDLFFAEGLAGELKREPIDVLALCPGATRTNFQERAGGLRLSRDRMASAEQVAREGLAMLGRKSVHVVGGGNRFYTAFTRFAPRGPLRDATRSYMRRMTKPRKA